MRKSSFEVTLSSFYESMAWDVEFLMKIHDAERVVGLPEEKRSVFEAYVFRICANWEILVTELLIDCLNRDTTRYKEFTGFGISRHMTRETCAAILQGTGYLDFKSVSHLKHIARNILVPQYNPFKKIPHLNGEKIDEFYALRNYLAHYSDASKRRLRKYYEDRHGLKVFREPGEFLLAWDKKEKMPRMGAYVNNFIHTGDIMAEFLPAPISETGANDQSSDNN